MVLRFWVCEKPRGQVTTLLHPNQDTWEGRGLMPRADMERGGPSAHRGRAASVKEAMAPALPSLTTFPGATPKPPWFPSHCSSVSDKSYRKEEFSVYRVLFLIA